MTNILLMEHFIVSESSRFGLGSETPMHPSRTPLHPYTTPMRDPGGTNAITYRSLFTWTSITFLYFINCFRCFLYFK